MPAVQTEALTQQYGDVTALDGLSLSVPEGACFGLLGPNGSGKTSTIEILTGQREPTSGSATVLGTDPEADPVGVRRAIGILPEREDPPSFLTPREYLRFVADVRDLPDPTDRIGEWAGRLGFRGVLDTLAGDLSEGERQRVMLAAAFLHEPSLVFIDEPLVNLDPLMQETVKDLLADYCDRGNTLFLSTHFVPVAAELCTQVAILVDGSLAAEPDVASLDADGLLAAFTDEVEAAGVPAGAGGGHDAAAADTTRQEPPGGA